MNSSSIINVLKNLARRIIDLARRIHLHARISTWGLAINSCKLSCKTLQDPFILVRLPFKTQFLQAVIARLVQDLARI